MTCLADFVASQLKPLHDVQRPIHRFDNDCADEREAQSVLERDLEGALAWFDPDNYHDWVDNGQRLVGLGWLGLKLWTQWSAKSSKYDFKESGKKWLSFRGTRTHYAAIFAEAKRRGWSNPPRGYWTGVEVPEFVREFSRKFAERET